MIRSLGQFNGVDRQFDVHVAFNSASPERVGEFSDRLGDHLVSIVVEPVDERADRRRFLVFDQRCVVIAPAADRRASEKPRAACSNRCRSRAPSRQHTGWGRPRGARSSPGDRTWPLSPPRVALRGQSSCGVQFSGGGLYAGSAPIARNPFGLSFHLSHRPTSSSTTRTPVRCWMNRSPGSPWFGGGRGLPDT